MSFLGNVLWFIFGGFLSGLSWLLSGILWCITIIGIPYGKQCFKFATMSFAPFGKEIEYGGGVPSLLANVICWNTNGTRKFNFWLSMVYNNSGYSVWSSIFQNR